MAKRPSPGPYAQTPTPPPVALGLRTPLPPPATLPTKTLVPRDSTWRAFGLVVVVTVLVVLALGVGVLLLRGKGIAGLRAPVSSLAAKA